MLFRMLAKEHLAKLFALMRSNPIIGPTCKDTDRNGSPLYDFAVVEDFRDVCLDYTTTVLPAKRFALPYRETISTFRIFQESWHKQVNYNIEQPMVLFGLHPCDINAFQKLDKVLLGSVYPNPFYAAKRKNMFIIGKDCEPQPQCFCRSMGTDTVDTGFDMFLTDFGDEYFVEILTAPAFHFLEQLNTREPGQEEHSLYRQKAATRNNRFTTKVDTTDLNKILDMEFHSPVWEQWGEQCFSCGTCANVCPTCYCYGVEESVSLDMKKARKTRQLYSCNLVDFAEVAGGHNFRPTADTRLKYRYYHKHRGFVEAFEEPLCVGCGRCGTACLAGITVPAVIESVRQGEI